MRKTAEGKLTPDDILSGSQVATVLGKNPFQTPNDVFKRSLDVLNGIEPEFKPHESMTWGNAFELDILNEGCSRLGLGNPKTTFDGAFFHKELPLAVSLDGMIKGDGKVIHSDPSRNLFLQNCDELELTGDIVVEAKLTGQDLETELADYRGKWQLQAQMMCTGAKLGFVFVLYKGTQLRIFGFKADPDMQKQIAEAAIDFKRRLLKYEQAQEIEWYPIETVTDAQKIYDEATEETVNLSEMENKVESILQMRQDIKDMEEQIKLYQAQIMAKMADRKYAQAGNYLVTWGEMNFKATPEKITPAKPARTVRSANIRIKYNG
jgi:predicted phage-related endonuclease